MPMLCRGKYAPRPPGIYMNAPGDPFLTTVNKEKQNIIWSPTSSVPPILLSRSISSHVGAMLANQFRPGRPPAGTHILPRLVAPAGHAAAAVAASAGPGPASPAPRRWALAPELVFRMPRRRPNPCLCVARQSRCHWQGCPLRPSPLSCWREWSVASRPLPAFRLMPIAL